MRSLADQFNGYDREMVKFYIAYNVIST